MQGFFQRGLLVLFALLALMGQLGLASAQDVDFLDPEQAFVLSVANHSPHEIDIHFEIAPEYYMYQERFQFELSAPGATLGEPEKP